MLICFLVFEFLRPGLGRSLHVLETYSGLFPAVSGHVSLAYTTCIISKFFSRQKSDHGRRKRKIVCVHLLRYALLP